MKEKFSTESMTTIIASHQGIKHTDLAEKLGADCRNIYYPARKLITQQKIVKHKAKGVTRYYTYDFYENNFDEINSGSNKLTEEQKQELDNASFSPLMRKPWIASSSLEIISFGR